MNKLIIFGMATLFIGCLKTRAEIDAEKSGAVQERQTIAQQRGTAIPQPAAGGAPAAPQVVRVEKAPPGAYRFEEYDEQMRTLSGRVDSLENYVQQQNAAKSAEQNLGAKEKQDFDTKFQAYEEALQKLEAQVAALNDEVARLKAPPPEMPVAKGKTSYDVGEDHFAAKKWKEAIVSYQKYRDQNPKGKLFADATYKIGVCFQELGMKDEARTFLEDVKSKYPNSKEAKKAAFRLKSLK